MAKRSRRNSRSSDTEHISPFLDLDSEQEAVLGLTAEVQARLNAFRDQIIDPRNLLKFRHGRTWSGPTVQYADTEGEFTEHSHEMTTKFEEIINGDLGLIERTISEISDGIQKSLSNAIFQKMHEATEKTGNIVQAGNKTWPENLVEIYGKIKLAVDQDGQISLPIMAIHPSQQSKIQSEMAAMDDAMRQKLNAVIGERVREAIAEEDARLSKFESEPNAEA